MNSALMFSKASDEWSTPQDFWRELDAEFHFDIDVAATRENSKCEEFYTEDTNALTWPWSLSMARGYQPVCWMNPPYSQVRQFIAKAADEARNGCTVVCLIPSRTDTRWWHEHVWDGEKHQPRPGVEVRFIKGRLKFGGSKNSAPFPSAIVVFRPPA